MSTDNETENPYEFINSNFPISTGESPNNIAEDKDAFNNDAPIWENIGAPKALSLVANSANGNDRSLILLDTQFGLSSVDAKGKWDVARVSKEDRTKLYISVKSEKYATKTIPVDFQQLELNLGFTCSKDKEPCVIGNHEFFDNAYRSVIMDKKTGQMHDLKDGPYEFINDITFTERFVWILTSYNEELTTR